MSGWGPEEALRVAQLVGAGESPSSAGVSRLLVPRADLLGADGLRAANAELAARVLGAGPLQELLDRPDVTDVLVNGVDGVWVDDGSGLRRTSCEVGDADAVRRLAVRLAGLAGRRLDDASPYVDGCLPGGVRLHAILPPLVPTAAHLSLRVPRRRAPRLADLRSWGSVTEAAAAWLRALVAAKASYVVTGGTGSGKTTLLAALLAEVPADERIVVVEDVAELCVDHPHLVRLEGRSPNVEGRGGVDLVALVRQSLRMRPDRLVVGEVRGGEVRELLTALNTGHEGGAGTLHANRIEDVVARVEALGALAGMTPQATRAQLGSAVEAVVHLRRTPQGRRIETIGVLCGRGPRLSVVPAWRADGGPCPGADALRQRLGLAAVPVADDPIAAQSHEPVPRSRVEWP